MSQEGDNSEINNGPVGYQPKINEVAHNFLEDLQKERSRLSEDFPLCALLIEEAIDRVFSTGRIPGREFHADVLKQKPMKLTQKVFVPVKQYPKFNFTGKILGPKGNSLIRLQEETQCKITIKGRNSMRDKVKEEELRKSSDPRFSHLNKDLFLEISTVATPAECYARIAYALAEIRKYLIPDKNDEVSHDQLREIMEIDPELARAGYGANPQLYKSVFDKPGSSKASPRYLGILKRTSYAEHDESEGDYEYEHGEQLAPHTPAKRAPSSSGYEYMKGLSEAAIMDVMSSSLQQQRVIVEQLRREAAVDRQPVSESCAAMMRYISQHEQEDYLLTGFTSQKVNPFREKSSCAVL